MTSEKSNIMHFVNLRNGFILIVLVLLVTGVVYFVTSSRTAKNFDIDKVEIEGVDSINEQNARMKVKNLELQLMNFNGEKDNYQRLDKLFLCASPEIIVNTKLKGNTFSILDDENFSTVFPIKVSFTTGADGAICMNSVSIIAN